MDVPQPVLLLVVPADWSSVPEGVTELRRCLGEDYGGRLTLRMARAPLRSPHRALLRAVAQGRAAPRATGPDPAHRGRVLQLGVAGAGGSGLMCGRADDHFGPRNWRTLGELFGPLGWEPGFKRDEVRPTDQLRFVRRITWRLRGAVWTLGPDPCPDVAGGSQALRHL